MITEDYVSFEIAKLLKEKGFDAKCDKCYAYFADDDIRFLNLKYPKSAKLLIENRYPCVTLQMACKWLREVHNINIEIRCTKTYAEAFIMTIADLPKCLCRGISSNKYEQTAEAAIKYYLENLV